MEIRVWRLALLWLGAPLGAALMQMSALSGAVYNFGFMPRARTRKAQRSAATWIRL